MNRVERGLGDVRVSELGVREVGLELLGGMRAGGRLLLRGESLGNLVVS